MSVYMMHMRDRSGFLLVDILLGIAVFAIIIGSLISGLAFSHRETIGSGDRIRAVYVAEAQLEAVRSIRDQDFANLTAGTHGVAVQDGLWTLSGTGTVSEAGYISSVTLTEEDEDRFSVTANTSWNFGVNRSGSLVLHTEIVNWRKQVNTGDWTTVSVDGMYEDAGTPLFNDAVTHESFLFVSSETSDGGDGLYVFDISDTANPTRVASSYTLADPVYDLYVSDQYLFAVTGQSTEIVVYDITSPATLSASDIVTTVDVDGSGKAVSLTVDENTMYVGTQAGGSAVSMTSYDISNINSITKLDTYDETENYNSIAVAGDFAYVASGMDTSELRIVDVSAPSFLEIATSSGGYNLTDTSDAFSVQAIKDYALLGRGTTSVSEEIVLFDISPDVLSGNGPWYFEAGATVNGVDMDPAETYGFIASENTGKEFSVVSISTFASGSNPEVSHYDTDTGVGRGVYYSWNHDRAILLTNTAVIILKPAS